MVSPSCSDVEENCVLLTKGEVAIVVLDSLSKVDVGINVLAIELLQASTEHGNAGTALDGEADVLGSVGESCGTD